MVKNKKKEACISRKIVDEGKRIIKEEVVALLKLEKHIGEDFEKAVDLMKECRGKIVIIGMGKSGLVGRKISATLASTGTPSFFIHPGEAIHGDLGMILPEDVCILISHSGKTKEVLEILPFIKTKGSKTISITSNPNSELAKNTDIHLNTFVKKEACPLNLAPTTSTTITLVMGDALASALIIEKGFKREDFAMFHPGGSLGKQLLLRVESIMHSGKENAVINENVSMKEALIEMTKKTLGAVNVIDEKGKLVGLITDGDLRRTLEKHENIQVMKVKDVMTKNPLTITKDILAAETLRIMEDRPSQIMHLPVVDNNKKCIGLVRLHDIIRAGIPLTKKR